MNLHTYHIVQESFDEKITILVLKKEIDIDNHFIKHL